MSSLRLSSRLFAFVSLCLYLSTLPSGLGQEPFQVKFRVVADMIVVPVTINGAGPFDFLLDTGNTDTIIDRKLAEELHLSPAGAMILMTPQGDAVTPRAHTNSLSMAGASVRGLILCVVNHYADIRPKVRGSLGEDFLRYFDLLIDNQGRLLQFELGPGPLADMLTGKRMPLSLQGFDEEKLTRTRLVVVGNIFGNKDMKLQLDSGTPSIVLFRTLNTSPLISSGSHSHSLGGILGGDSLVDPQTARFLRLGDKVFHDLTVFVPRGKIPPMDVDGLLPTSLFRSIFISHSGRFVILDPSTKKPDAGIAVVQSMRREPPE